MLLHVSLSLLLMAEECPMVWMDMVCVSIHMVKDIDILSSLGPFKVKLHEHSLLNLHMDSMV